MSIGRPLWEGKGAVVASCDFYEFSKDLVVRITSYTALLPTD